jgi:serine-type D-Ala-D-Ala carboxypeptidase/endopeptidase
VRAARRPHDVVGLDAVDLLAERAMRSGRRVGLVVGCLQDGERRVVGHGRVRLDGPDVPDGGTIFEIGSITKVFTALLLGDLASHAAGLPRDPKGTLGRWLGDRHNPNAVLTVEQLYAGFAKTRLRRRPGDRVRYSNLGGGLLGQALARAAGQPYEELVRQRICLPLGMPDTMIAPTGEQAGRLATGHTRRGRPVHPLELPALAGAGALRSTANDLLRSWKGARRRRGRAQQHRPIGRPARPAAAQGAGRRGRLR